MEFKPYCFVLFICRNSLSSFMYYICSTGGGDRECRKSATVGHITMKHISVLIFMVLMHISEFQVCFSIIYCTFKVVPIGFSVSVPSFLCLLVLGRTCSFLWSNPVCVWISGFSWPWALIHIIPLNHIFVSCHMFDCLLPIVLYYNVHFIRKMMFDRSPE